MAIEFDIRIIGETTAAVVQELGALTSRLSTVLGVGPTQPDNLAILDALMPEDQSARKGMMKGSKVRVRDIKPNGPEPESKPIKSEQGKLDRAAIIDGLTKIYSKGDEDVRLAITKFRDGQGADRLRDLKDDALPAAAELLTELKTAADQPSV